MCKILAENLLKGEHITESSVKKYDLMHLKEIGWRI
jgi:hypothetical protein